eukprot:CAMPEP_0179074076 /NCGR_PEP_ID=MMETSP0796-20121207/32900_1 /TAXON_ID=73915 /ORGANISM="Pyrodinium bahamense, Strain pbaha01" /LENGTH=48 /DNA_ID= /DNA_START= /DNA_END= /DNA_ORIENTATION=
MAGGPRFAFSRAHVQETSAARNQSRGQVVHQNAGRTTITLEPEAQRGL